jgi:hypothetical protein
LITGGANAAAVIKRQSQTGGLSPDVGQNEQKIKRKQIFTAGLDKVGFIEAQGFNPGQRRRPGRR